MSTNPSLQERYAPHNTCFGCGPANAQGLRIRSFAEGDEVARRLFAVERPVPALDAGFEPAARVSE